jgi:hypothetical protein
VAERVKFTIQPLPIPQPLPILNQTDARKKRMPEIRKFFRRTDETTLGCHGADRISILDRVFLHVGLEKTGATKLQVTMAPNRRLLKTHGYFFPTTLEGSASNHIGLALCAANPEAATDLRQYAGLTRRGLCLISAEVSKADRPRAGPIGLPYGHPLQ